MTQFYKQRLVCIARCKNEIHIIKKWYESLPFVDVFVVTDNNSTDGTYEYLKSLPNVIVIRLEEFDEGRDFQILLKVAKSLKPEWLLKIDCDEIFEDLAIRNMDKLLEQKEYDTVFFRKYSFDYRLPKNKCFPTRDSFRPAHYLVRVSKNIYILNKKIHVGSFLFYKKPVLSNFRIKHYYMSSYNKSIEKYNTYVSVDRGKNYSSLLDKDINIKGKSPISFKEPEIISPGELANYGLGCIFVTDKEVNIEKPNINRAFLYLFFKMHIMSFVAFLRLNSFIIFIKEKKQEK